MINKKVWERSNDKEKDDIIDREMTSCYKLFLTRNPQIGLRGYQSQSNEKDIADAFYNGFQQGLQTIEDMVKD